MAILLVKEKKDKTHCVFRCVDLIWNDSDTEICD